MRWNFPRIFSVLYFRARSLNYNYLDFINLFYSRLYSLCNIGECYSICFACTPDYLLSHVKHNMYRRYTWERYTKKERGRFRKKCMT